MRGISIGVVSAACVALSSPARAEPSATNASIASSVAVVSAEGVGSSPVFDPDAPKLNTEITRSSYPNRPLLTTGSVLLVSSYVPAVVGAAISDRQGDDNLYIPVAGPWMAMTRGADEKPGYKALLIADGALQGVGALAVLSSLFIPEERTRRWRLLGQSESLRLTPHVATRSVGLGASGRF